MTYSTFYVLHIYLNFFKRDFQKFTRGKNVTHNIANFRDLLRLQPVPKESFLIEATPEVNILAHLARYNLNHDVSGYQNQVAVAFVPILLHLLHIYS